MAAPIRVVLGSVYVLAENGTMTGHSDMYSAPVWSQPHPGTALALTEGEVDGLPVVFALTRPLGDGPPYVVAVNKENGQYLGSWDPPFGDASSLEYFWGQLFVTLPHRWGNVGDESDEGSIHKLEYSGCFNRDAGKATLEVFDRTQKESTDLLEAGRVVAGDVRMALKVEDVDRKTDGVPVEADHPVEVIDGDDHPKFLCRAHVLSSSDRRCWE